MGRLFRKLTGLMLLTAMVSGAGMAAYGAESSVVEKVTVTFKTEYGEPEEIPEPEITASGTGYSLGDIQYRTNYDKWKPGKKVRVEITLNAEDGKHFPVSLNRSDCKVSGANFVSAKALDDDSLQVKVDYIPVTVLGNTEKAGWSKSSKKKAVWKKVEHAPGYTVTLYGDDKVVKRLNVESTNVDLADYMKDLDKTYYYEVKAIPLTSEQKKYLKEGSYVTSTDQEFDEDDYRREEANTADAGDGGSFKGNGYVLPDGTRVKNTWKKNSGRWYYFDGNGNKATGFINVEGKWYLMGQDGAMCTGWMYVNNNWYYLGPDGDMQTGWIQPAPSSWYYMNPSGCMERGWINVDGKWYYLAQDGKMQTGWVNDNGRWFYLNGDGSMAANTTVEGWYIGADGVAAR